MIVEMTLELSPPSIFGLPEGDLTVVPGAASRDVCTKVIDRRTGQVAGHGTLSRFRLDSELVKVEAGALGVRLRLNDNFLSASVEADGAEAGLESIRAVVDAFLSHASLSVGTSLTGRIQGVLFDDELQPRPAGSTSVGSVRFYDTASLQAVLTDAVAFAELADSRLAAALAYYSSALQLRNASEGLTVSGPAVGDSLLVAEFLTLWKAVCAVVGDPARRPDRYQSRYQSVGVTDELKAEIDELKQIRDDSDVAHYTLSAESLDAVRTCIVKARRVVADTIRAYRQHLNQSHE